MKWLYLSPHLDDVALSCGGLLWEQAARGDEPVVWTLCAGLPPEGRLSEFAASLHARWQTGPEATLQRREEDIESCRRLNSTHAHGSMPDCIYRRGPVDGDHLYTSEESLWRPVNPAEWTQVAAVRAGLSQRFQLDAVETHVVAPLGLGGHVDHRLTRMAAEGLGRPLLYYADYPYVLQAGDRLQALRRAGWQEARFPLAGAALAAWTEAVAAHQSQISSFWPDLESMRLALHRYSHEMGGVTLWHRPEARA